MACVEASVTQDAIALVAATPKVVGYIKAPANQALRVKRVSVTFDGNSSTAVPGIVDLVRLTDDGTAGEAETPRRKNLGSETIQTTAVYNGPNTAFSGAPSVGDILDRKHSHPQGQYNWTPVSFDEVHVPGGTRLGVRATFAANVNCVLTFHWEE